MSVVLPVAIGDVRVRQPGSGRILATSIVLIGGTLALSVLPQLHDDLLTRLSRTLSVNGDDVSGQARVLQNAGLAHLANTAPWFGWGLSTSGRVGVSGKIVYGTSGNNVGSNWVASMWVDGAWLALPLTAVLLIAFVVGLRTIQGQLLLLVLLNSFFSNATFQPITWLLVGLCFAHSRQKGDEKKTQLDNAKIQQRSTAVKVN